MSENVLEHVKRLTTSLSQPERACLLAWLETALNDQEPMAAPPTSRRSLYGLCADLGTGPTDLDIDEVRSEMWANFPREDIA